MECRYGGGNGDTQIASHYNFGQNSNRAIRHKSERSEDVPRERLFEGFIVDNIPCMIIRGKDKHTGIATYSRTRNIELAV